MALVNLTGEIESFLVAELCFKLRKTLHQISYKLDPYKLEVFMLNSNYEKKND